jgi:uncharacterized protein (DUF885 family)
MIFRMRVRALMCLSVASLAASFFAPSVAVAQTAPSLEQRRAELKALFHEMWEDRLKHSPEFASVIGDKRYNAELSDYSVEAFNQALARDRAFLARLSAIDPAGLPTREKLSYELAVRQLVEEQTAARFKEWQLPVNQFYGFHTALPDLVQLLHFDTEKDYADYIARMRAAPRAFNQITVDMQLGLDDGRTPPRALMEKVLAQVNDIANKKPEESPFALPLKHFPAGITPDAQTHIHDELLAVIRTQVLPSYVRFAKFLETQYIPKARTDPGLWAMPGGDDYYAFRVKQSTTTNLTPEEVHQLGLKQVAEIEPQLIAVVHSLGFTDLKSFHEALLTNPKEHAQSGEQLLALYKHYADQMQVKLPTLFTKLPKTPLAVVPMPGYSSADQVPADYQQGTADGSRPGWIRVNISNADKRLLTQVEAIAYHEGVPGHHLQISLAQEQIDLPEFRRYLDFTAYTEGWALYSERLGKEVGFYTNPYSEYGRLENEMWRAVRLVVDTGVHYKHWTRQQMVDYFHAHTAMDEINVQTEVDRYIAWPGQALGYKIGQLKILELRARAQQQLGAQFDIRRFHDLVVEGGALPMDVLEQRVNEWIATQKGSPSPAATPSSQVR